MKSVQSEVKLQENDRKILRNLYQNREGLRVLTLMKLTSLKKRTIYKRLKILKEKELIENIFPIWKIVNGQVPNCAKFLNSSNIFELHNLSYVLKLIKKPEWWSKRKSRLSKVKGWQFKNIDFGKGGTNPYQQIINENFVIQAYPESLIIIARKRYYGNNPYETIIEGMNDVLDIIEWFEERMRFKFFGSGIPALELRNNDFNRLQDSLAVHCRKEGRRFLVELDKHRKVWVDYSEPFGKEANYPEGQEILEKVTKDLLMHKSYLPSEMKGFVEETAQQIQQVTQNQIMFDKNFQSHLKVIQDLGKAINELRKEIKIKHGNK